LADERCLKPKKARAVPQPRPPPPPAQDGKEIKPSERIAAAQVWEDLDRQLRSDLEAEGVDVAAAAACEDDGGAEEGVGAEVEETGFVDENGELRRPWCPATRILEHREAVS
jgi:protein TilB